MVDKYLEKPELLLQKLIQFNTVYGSGMEKDCMLFIKSLFDELGVESKLYFRDKNRPNLFLTIKSYTNYKEPVLMYGHVDVVPVSGQDYDHSLLVLSDEENTGYFGALCIIEDYPEILEGIKYAFDEAGHTNTAMSKMSRTINVLSENRLPVRIVKSSRLMIKSFANSYSGVTKMLLNLMLYQLFTNKILDILKSDGKLFDLLLHNNINVTIVEGGSAINVIPSVTSFYAHLRTLPETSIDTAIMEIKQLFKSKANLKVEDYDIIVELFDENLWEVDMKLYDNLSLVLKDM